MFGLLYQTSVAQCPTAPATFAKLFSARFSTEIMIEATFSLHLRLQIGQLRDRHVDVAAADVRRVPEICGHADHAPVYPEPLVRPAVVTSIVPRRLRGQ